MFTTAIYGDPVAPEFDSRLILHQSGQLNGPHTSSLAAGACFSMENRSEIEEFGSTVPRVASAS
jgi:hypothetical protein